MKEVKLPCRYIGADIVDNVIEKNRSLHGSEHLQFVVLDATRDVLPQDVDVVLCREVLFHLSYADAQALIKNVKRSKAEFFIATNNSTTKNNVDTYTGGFRQLNLRLPPFGFPEPIEIIPD